MCYKFCESTKFRKFRLSQGLILYPLLPHLTLCYDTLPCDINDIKHIKLDISTTVEMKPKQK